MFISFQSLLCFLKFCVPWGKDTPTSLGQSTPQCSFISSSTDEHKHLLLWLIPQLAWGCTCVLTSRPDKQKPLNSHSALNSTHSSKSVWLHLWKWKSQYLASQKFSPLIVKKISLHLVVLLVTGFSKNGNVLKGISWSKSNFWNEFYYVDLWFKTL